MEALPEKKAIVVVEDNQPIAELIKDTLNAEPDYQAVAVHDGARAVETIRSLKASLVLLDLDLPGLNGLDLYDILQDDPSTQNIPVIFVTANASRKDFHARRFEYVIEKPFDLDELLDRVGVILRPEDRAHLKTRDVS